MEKFWLPAITNLLLFFCSKSSLVHILYYSTATDETIEAQANDIVMNLLRIASKWFELGVLLGISVTKLEEVQAHTDLKQCLYIITMEWLRNTKPEHRTWQFLASAIGDKAGGGDSMLAEEFAQGLRGKTCWYEAKVLTYGL